MTEPQSSWILPAVADGHTQLALQELQQDPQTVDPFKYFIQAMEFIQPTPGMTILDVGCGAGAYGELCDRLFPGLIYTGTDFSAPMIANAQMISAQPERFAVREFYANNFSAYDIVLASSVIEYARQFDGLRFLLEHARHWVILHRLRLTDGPSHAFDEPTYAGQSARHFIWNAEEIVRMPCIRYLPDSTWRSILWERGDHATMVMCLNPNETRRVI